MFAERAAKKLARAAHDENEAVSGPQYAEWLEMREYLSWLRTEALRRKAVKFGVVFPELPPAESDGNEWWERGHILRWPTLTAKGWVEVRNAIREEEEYRRKVWAHRREWISVLLSICVGFVGAATGLVSALVALAALKKAP
jgi:hypothetical protein